MEARLHSQTSRSNWKQCVGMLKLIALQQVSAVAIPLPFPGAILGFSAVFRGLPLRRRSARETPENLAASSGGPNGIRTRVSALRGPCPRPLDDGATSVRRKRLAGRGGLEPPL